MGRGDKAEELHNLITRIQLAIKKSVCASILNTLA
jgi:hypothetical protein